MILPASVKDLIRYATSFTSISGLTADTPQNVLAAATNTKGVIVWAASFSDQAQAQYQQGGLIAKATAPTSAGDGVMVCGPDMASGMKLTAEHATIGGRLRQPLFLPAGLRLDWIMSNTNYAGTRSVLYTVL